MIVRVFENPDGSLRIVHPNWRGKREDETESEFLERVFTKIQTDDSSLLALPFQDVDKTVLPPDRSRRHAWRLQADRVVDDPTMPDLPHPRQALLDAAEAATTIAGLRAVLRQFIGGTI